MSDDRSTLSRRTALKATAGTAVGTVAMAGTAAADRITTQDVSTGDCFRLPRRIPVYESCTDNTGRYVSAGESGTIEAICFNRARVLVDWDDPYLSDGYVDIGDILDGLEPC